MAPPRKWKNPSAEKLYAVWQAMLSRCHRPNSARYQDYGGRGITVCDRWRSSYDAFVEDMGYPKDGFTLERIDNNQGYTKENCEWTTRTEQNFNARRRSTNTSGIVGVCFVHKKWAALYYIDGIQNILYSGPDFFEACCRRKSWENSRSRYI